MSERPVVAWLGEKPAHDVSLVGGKAAALSKLADTYPVPRGFVLTTAAQSLATQEGNEVLVELVAEPYQRLTEGIEGPDAAVAVRSSAVDEDGAGASFAGQYETYLNVCGTPAVSTAAIACFESAQAEHALEYRRRQGFGTDSVQMAVLVQQLIPADAAAVAFSANPVSHSRSEVVINANWGLGESIVGGTVTPDTYVVSKGDLTVSERFMGAKESMTVRMEGGTEEVDVPKHLRDRYTLADEEIVELARLALSLEEQNGHPVDIEAAFHARQLYLLQSRPITALGEA